MVFIKFPYLPNARLSRIVIGKTNVEMTILFLVIVIEEWGGPD